eukprot:4067919-Pyramimonas_sp.AAC.1
MPLTLLAYEVVRRVIEWSGGHSCVVCHSDSFHRVSTANLSGRAGCVRLVPSVFSTAWTPTLRLQREHFAAPRAFGYEAVLVPYGSGMYWTEA